jgi:hypothetical protein
MSVETIDLSNCQKQCLEELNHNRINATPKGSVGWNLSWQYPTKTPIPKWITVRSLIIRNIVFQVPQIQRVVFSAHKEDMGIWNDNLKDIS